MTNIQSLTVQSSDPAAANAFYDRAFGLGSTVQAHSAQESSSGFRGFSLSLVVPQPSTVNALVESAVAAGAQVLKPVAKSFWGYGGVVQAPDGTICKVATSSKKEKGAPDGQVDDIVLLLGVADIVASKRFYIDHGLTVARSFGRKYAEFTNTPGGIKLALYGRRALAKDVGVDMAGDGSHRIVIGSDAAPFTDPDGFCWGTAA